MYGMMGWVTMLKRNGGKTDLKKITSLLVVLNIVLREC